MERTIAGIFQLQLHMCSNPIANNYRDKLWNVCLGKILYNNVWNCLTGSEWNKARWQGLCSVCAYLRKCHELIKTIHVCVVFFVLCMGGVPLCLSYMAIIYISWIWPLHTLLCVWWLVSVKCARWQLRVSLKIRAKYYNICASLWVDALFITNNEKLMLAWLRWHLTKWQDKVWAREHTHLQFVVRIYKYGISSSHACPCVHGCAEALQYDTTKVHNQR